MSNVVAKQDHKTDFLLVALGRWTRHTRQGKNLSFMGQIKVRIEVISLLCLKENISPVWFSLKNRRFVCCGHRICCFICISGAFRVHREKQGKVTQVWMTGMVGGHDPDSRVLKKEDRNLGSTPPDLLREWGISYASKRFSSNERAD